MKSPKKSDSKNPFLALLMKYGVMRVILAAAALVMMAMVPAKGAPAVYHGWGMVPTVLVPVLVPILFMVLMLEVLMSCVFIIDKTGAERARYRVITLVNLALAIGLLVFWVPYYIALIPK